MSPHLKRFDQRLLCCLSKRVSVMRWEYLQTEDEACSLDVAIHLLHEYLQGHFEHTQKSVHLIGHGLSGIVGWLYAQQYPEHVRSLTLLSVGANPAINWHAHYYALRQLLPCSREVVLAQMVRMLFGARSHDITRSLVHLLAQDLDTGLALHSLLENQEIQSAQVGVPLLVCQGEHDAVVSGRAAGWQPWLKPADSVWTCPQGHHFFHFDQPRQVETAVLKHWRHVDQLRPISIAPSLLKLSS
ncbi:MAG: alpha/beta hydrolase [Cyanobacteria bacterium J06642_11]